MDKVFFNKLAWVLAIANFCASITRACVLGGCLAIGLSTSLVALNAAPP